MIEDNYKAAARLIAITEEQTKLPVRIDWDDQLTFGAILRLSEVEWSKQLRISVNPKRKDIAYLVGSQCAVALRFFSQKETKHLVSKAGSVDKTINEFIQLGFNAEQAELYAKHYESGLGKQLRGMPAQIAISSWIYKNYPELRDSQKVYALTEAESAIPSLSVDSTQIPAWILDSHQAMNGAFALATDYLFTQNELFEPYEAKGLEGICMKLLDDVINSAPETSDTELVSLWLNRLELNDRFEWNTF